MLQTAPTLGTASSFAVLGGSTVTNTGASVVQADLGVSPGSAVTGFPPGTVVNGTIHAADALAAQAEADTTTAYNALASQACTMDLTGQDLGGKTLTPGVYCFSSSAGLTGALTLNALGNASSVFVFKIGTTLITASGSSVRMINPGSPCGVFWQVGSSATLGTTTSFIGSILALTSITLNTNASVSGRTLARNGAVTLDTNTIGTAACAVGLGTATPTATLPPLTATAVAVVTATAAAAATAAAIPPPSSPKPPAPAPTANLSPADRAALATATAFAAITPTATLPPATPTAALPPATPTPVVAPTATAIAPVPAAANAAAPAAAIPTPTAAVPIEAAPAPPSPIPSTLPRTGVGLPPLGLLSLLLGVLSLALAFTVRRARK